MSYFMIIFPNIEKASFSIFLWPTPRIASAAVITLGNFSDYARDSYTVWPLLVERVAKSTWRFAYAYDWIS